MKSSLVNKNYLFGTKISFLMISFIILTIAITVQHDIWPFLMEKLPITEQYHSWSSFAIVFGLAVPSLWLLKDWQYSKMRYSLISIIVMYLLQIVTEVTVCHYFFISMVVPTAIIYSGYRLLQFLNLQRLVYKTNYPTKFAIWSRSVIILTSLLYWGTSLFRLVFITFPQLIPDL